MKKTNSPYIAVWSPSLSPGYGRHAPYDLAQTNLANAGIVSVWAPNARNALAVRSKDKFDSIPAAEKIADLEWVLRSNARLLMCAIGGYNSYQLLDQINWSALKDRGIVLIGHSDFTTLGNAYYAKADGLAWYGPNFRNLCDRETGARSVHNFVNALSQSETSWQQQYVYKDSFKAPVKRSSGWYVIRPGTARGIGIGGNVGTFFLLQGTPYMPAFDKPVILFLEEDEMPGIYAIREFDRKLRSILDQPGAREQIKGLIIGRFLDPTKTTRTMIAQVVDDIPFFDDKPVIANVEIGHGMPRLMLPIGGMISMSATGKKIVVYNPVTGAL